MTERETDQAKQNPGGEEPTDAKFRLAVAGIAAVAIIAFAVVAVTV